MFLWRRLSYCMCPPSVQTFAHPTLLQQQAAAPTLFFSSSTTATLFLVRNQIVLDVRRLHFMCVITPEYRSRGCTRTVVILTVRD